MIKATDLKFGEHVHCSRRVNDRSTIGLLGNRLATGRHASWCDLVHEEEDRTQNYDTERTYRQYHSPSHIVLIVRRTLIY